MNVFSQLPNISNLRREYTKGKLNRKDLPDNPLILFDYWLIEACKAYLPDPTAMILATVDSNGQPYQRTVLLKQYDVKGLVFFTNFGSRKVFHFNKNPNISLHFLWHLFDRQLMILGRIEKLSIEETLKYFRERPRESQISAWVSKQSSYIKSREILEKTFIKMDDKFKNREIPLPNFWGGFRVKVNTMEFWQGGKHRLHDRFLYKLEDNVWEINRLAP
ncbi:pyridoxamine 5'-phosphate oxidase [Candidatus Pantoea edessiphila]|uniref:Pyridoxine/pyridoxamine 5'-phosphate oxidase n=1 Tax=Candidatus Pantoea edessiphila TaxID=2044610 RepID=A0A2P5SYR7_9GAMM|nr:pyridoxamine 5'-phosphate oxidase [Candidatus Pantoea edessiphila]MBK4775394.1 pyridoxamine 5'-phosphate oxidase [Pantoea sp. Edef]PPI87476.1 pyridoxamine 5'-phosphate oxidase [Candidatus Pantoea edessiphila]